MLVGCSLLSRGSCSSGLKLIRLKHPSSPLPDVPAWSTSATSSWSTCGPTGLDHPPPVRSLLTKVLTLALQLLVTSEEAPHLQLVLVTVVTKCGSAARTVATVFIFAMPVWT